MTLRLNCLVPGCHRTRGRHKGEEPIRAGEQWVCGQHWRNVPRQMRALLGRARRRSRRVGTEAAWNAQHRIWRRCVRAAIERSVGL